MNAMIMPMIQQDLATTKDIKDLKSYVDDGFDKTNEHIDNLESITEKGFAGVRSEMREHKEEIKAHFERSIGVMHEKFQGDLKIVSEYLGDRIDAHDVRFDRLENKFDKMLEIVQSK